MNAIFFIPAIKLHQLCTEQSVFQDTQTIFVNNPEILSAKHILALNIEM